MAPKKPAVEKNEAKRKIVRRTIELKKEIIAQYERGIRVSELALQYGMAKSTISTIIKHKETIKAADVAKGVKAITKQRSQLMEEMEKLLLVWITEKQIAGDRVSEFIISQKALQLYGDLTKNNPGTSAETFKGSHGWFEKFKKRSGIHNVLRHGEAASANAEAAEKFISDFADYIDAEGFVPQQVFNCDETGLFWKKMPNRTFITQEEKRLPGHKPMKDRLTLLLCGNASGDFKLKPLLVYHSENPRAFKRNHVIKSQLNVMWRANKKAWVTRQIFTEWVHKVFGPSVKTYLQEKQLPLRALLVMDNSPAHPPGLEETLIHECSFISVMFLPPNTTPLLQPMNQQVISNFKKLYTKALFQMCFEVTADTPLTLREFWKDHFNIFHCIRLIDEAWGEVSNRTMNSAWRKLWPDAVAERVLEGFRDEAEPVVNEIVSLGESMGLEVDTVDVEELVEEPQEELTTEELQDLEKEQRELDTSEEEEQREELPTSALREMCSKWSELHELFLKHHPDRAGTDRILNLVDDHVVSHFRMILKKRQKQRSIERFLVKQEPAAKRQKQKTPERELPSATMERDSLSYK